MRTGTIQAAFTFGLIGVFVLQAATALCQEPTEREKQLEATIQQLLQRVDELEKRVDQTDTNQQNLQQTVEQKITAPAEQPKEDPNELKWTWNNGLTFGSKDGAYKFKLGGRLHNDWYAGSIDNGDFPDGTRFRRVWLNFSGTIYDDWEFKFLYGINGGEPNTFQDVYIGYTGLDFMKIRLGHVKEPFGLEQLTTNNDVTFMERTLGNAIVPSYETGLLLFNNVLDDRMTWAVGAFKNTNAYGDGDDNDSEGGDWDVMARVTGLPWYEDNGRQLIHLGLAGGHREWGDEPYRLNVRGSYSVGDRLVDTGLFDAESVDQMGAEFAAVYGPATLQAEYMYASVDPTLGSSGDINAYYVQASYFLTGESRPYKGGIFTRVKPKNNFSLENGGWGAWELAARYSYLDLTDVALSTAKGGKLNDYIAGLNWYLNPNMRIMWNYVHCESEDTNIKDQDADIYEMRFQIDF